MSRRFLTSKCHARETVHNRAVFFVPMGIQHKKATSGSPRDRFVYISMVRLKGIEPPHMVPETIALSTELQAYIVTTIFIIKHRESQCKRKKVVQQKKLVIR